MAVPAGAKKSKNGRRVYSQTANAIKKRKANKTGEFAPEIAAAAEMLPPPAPEAPPEAFISPGEFSTEEIGVTTTATMVPPEVPLAPHTEDQPNYHCMNCKGRISLMDRECPVCEETLDWSGLT